MPTFGHGMQQPAFQQHVNALALQQQMQGRNFMLSESMQTACNASLEQSLAQPGRLRGGVTANMQAMQSLRPFQFKRRPGSAQRHAEMNAPDSSDDAPSDGVGMDASGAPVGIVLDE